MGFAGARIQSIVVAAGVNIALLYYYFGTKEKLYAAVLEQVFAQWAQRVEAALDANGSPRQKLTAYLEGILRFCCGSAISPAPSAAGDDAGWARQRPPAECARYEVRAPRAPKGAPVASTRLSRRRISPGSA